MKLSKGKSHVGNPAPLRLTQEQVEQINEALSAVSDYGEVQLVVQRGILKYINVLKSYKAWDDDEAPEE